MASTIISVLALASAAAKLAKSGTSSSPIIPNNFLILPVSSTKIKRRELPAGWDKNLPVFPADPKGMATRESSGKVLNALAQNIPWLIGGSADLAKSNKTNLTL